MDGFCQEDEFYNAAKTEAHNKIFNFIKNEVLKSSMVVKFSFLTDMMLSSMKSSGVQTTIRTSTRTHLRRVIETEFGDTLSFLLTKGKKLLIYPKNIKTAQLVEENIVLHEKLENMEQSQLNELSTVTKSASYIHSAIKDMEQQDSSTWPPDPSFVNKEHVHIPVLLQS